VNARTHLLLALCAMLCGVIACTDARAQANDEEVYELKPLIPPVIPLPPKAQVNPGAALGRPLIAGDQAPPANDFRTPATTGPGLSITIPTR
jgi:hypothetical protein